MRRMVSSTEWLLVWDRMPEPLRLTEFAPKLTTAIELVSQS
jgi:hypothetical protein